MASPRDKGGANSMAFIIVSVAHMHAAKQNTGKEHVVVCVCVKHTQTMQRVDRIHSDSQWGVTVVCDLAFVSF